MLDRWEQISVEDVIDRIDRGGGDARARLRRLFALAAFVAADHGARSRAVVMELAAD